MEGGIEVREFLFADILSVLTEVLPTWGKRPWGQGSYSVTSLGQQMLLCCEAKGGGLTLQLHQ